MKLQRVQVPDFRVLKNVDISLEKDFVPNIFPLGSQNGGGKSTLLQLIFVLLHCSGDSDKHEFIKNMLHGFEIDDDSQKRVLAKFDIWDGEKTVNLEFVVYKDSLAIKLLKSPIESSNSKLVGSDSNYFLFSAPEKLNKINKEIEDKKLDFEDLSKIINRLEKISIIESADERELQLKNLERGLRKLNIFQFSVKRDLREKTIVRSIEELVLKKIDVCQISIKKLTQEREGLEYAAPKILNYLHSNKTLYICNYCTVKEKEEKENNEDKVLLCRVNELNINETKEFLSQIAQKIFIAAPTTQVFLFLAQKEIKQLFQRKNNYQLQTQTTKSKLKGFFTYDFFAINLLINIFKNARDKDFKQAIETGEYGNNYQQLVNDLNQILLNKKININPDLSGFTFKFDAEGHDIELYPEDLSHGELKRLSIYAWIKYNIIEDSIVLIDEIENGLHPDWQYQIIKDIAEWAPKNQYIIATHSYELCQVVTPAHVKELEPRLIKQESES
ncbi:MAG: AAA family ATPase [Cyanobacteria bacterium J06633_8]